MSNGHDYYHWDKGFVWNVFNYHKDEFRITTYTETANKLRLVVACQRLLHAAVFVVVLLGVVEFMNRAVRQ